MVPQHSDTPEGPPPSLSPVIARNLEDALRAFLKTPTSSVDELRSALQGAARDARDQGLAAEQLLIILKAMEQRIGSAIPEDPKAPTASRTRLIRAMIEAYYMR